jgi:hypothetical protein
MMNKLSSSSRTTTNTTIAAIAIAYAILLVGAFAVVPLVEQAHALDLKKIRDNVKSLAQGIRDRLGSPGHHNPHWEDLSFFV